MDDSADVGGAAESAITPSQELKELFSPNRIADLLELFDVLAEGKSVSDFGETIARRKGYKGAALKKPAAREARRLLREIEALEAHYGRQLFNRSGKRITVLTPLADAEGVSFVRRFQEYGRRMVHAASILERVSDVYQRPPRVRVGSYNSVIASVAPDLARIYSEALSLSEAAEFEWVLGDDHHHLTGLRSGYLDFAIMDDWFPYELEGLYRQPLTWRLAPSGLLFPYPRNPVPNDKFQPLRDYVAEDKKLPTDTWDVDLIAILRGMPISMMGPTFSSGTYSIEGWLSDLLLGNRDDLEHGRITQVRMLLPTYYYVRVHVAKGYSVGVGAAPRFTEPHPLVRREGCQWGSDTSGSDATFAFIPFDYLEALPDAVKHLQQSGGLTIYARADWDAPAHQGGLSAAARRLMVMIAEKFGDTGGDKTGLHSYLM